MSARNVRTFAALALVLLVAACVETLRAAHGPDDDWRVLETRSFRVHYPSDWEPWARHVVARLEPVRDVVVEAVGYRPDVKVDVVLTDPVGQPNAFAMTFLSAPRMVLWASPPGASSPIGEYHDWTELLLLHEDVHLVHLLRPSRSPLEQFGSWVVDISPLTFSSPRWLIEGYATLLEGRLTGSGRPNGDLRAAVLRARARHGRLPDYDTLGGLGKGWQDASMAYLAGSAFLEWLERDAGPDSLTNLWRRMTAREGRTFDESFEGVFGEPPREAYRRFVAETTWQSLEVERELRDVRVEGETWLEAPGATGRPAVAPDGSMFAVVLREPGKSAELVVYASQPDEDSERDREDEIDRMLARDPDDVAPVESDVRPRERLYVRAERDGAAPFAPRFLPSGESILFHRFVPDADGALRPDLFVWDLSSGSARRVTRAQDVRDADPAPDGTWAVAVRHRGGRSSIVRVDLADGAVDELVSGNVPDVFDHPRVSPDGTRVVFLAHRSGRWRVVVRVLADGNETELQLPERTSVAEPSWDPDGRHVWVTVGRDGFLDIARLDTARPDAPPQLSTRSVDGAVAPAPRPRTGEILFLGLTPDGRDVRSASASTLLAWSDVDPVDPALAPVVRPQPPEQPPRGDPEDVDPSVPEAREYRGGRPEVRPLGAWNLAPSVSQLLLGARVGDVVGRWETLALGSFGSSRGPRGWMVSGAWRGLPVELRARISSSEEKPSKQSLASPETGTSLDVERTGVEVAADWSRSVGTSLRVQAAGGGWLGRVTPTDASALDREVGFIEAAVRWRPSRGRWWGRVRGSARADVGRTDDQGWTRAGAVLGLAGGYGGVGLAVDAEWREVDDAVQAFDRIVLGGTDGAILSSVDVATRIVVPALPSGSRIGDRYEGGRAAIEFGRRHPVVVFWETHRLSPEGGPRPQATELVGAEWILRFGTQPLLRFPSTTLRLGFANVASDPSERLEGRTRGWIAVSWRP